MDEKSPNQQPIFHSLEDAAKDPSKVYRLEITLPDAKKLPEELFKFNNLRIFKLTAPRLELMSGIEKLTHLQELSLNTPLLQQLPASIGQLSELTSFLIGSSRLKTLPKEIAQLSNLQRLGITEHLLDELPREIGYLKNLRDLEIGGHLLSPAQPIVENGVADVIPTVVGTTPFHVPSEIGGLNNLEILYIGGLSNIEIPEELAKLQNLRKLVLNEDGLKQFPVALLSLNHLEYLDLAGNRLTALPSEIVKLENLKILNLTSNPIPEIEKANLKVLFKDRNIIVKTSPGDAEACDNEALSQASRSMQTMQTELQNSLSAMPGVSQARVELNMGNGQNKCSPLSWETKVYLIVTDPKNAPSQEQIQKFIQNATGAEAKNISVMITKNE